MLETKTKMNHSSKSSKVFQKRLKAFSDYILFLALFNLIFYVVFKSYQVGEDRRHLELTLVR